MNVVPLEPVLPEGLKRQLAALPEFAPPDGLRERVAARTWNAPRASWRPLALSAAAVLVLVAGAGILMQGQPPTAPASGGRMAGLERDVHALRVAGIGSVPAVAALEGELARIDRALAASLARGGPAADRERLWRDREAVLDQLLLAYRGPDRLIRI